MKSWKTGLAGILAIVPVVLHALFPLVVTGEIAATITSLLVSFGLIAAKDSNVTGGTKQQ